MARGSQPWSWPELLRAWYADPGDRTIRRKLFERLQPVAAECAEEHARRWPQGPDVEGLADEVLIDLIESGPWALAPHVQPQDVRGRLLHDHVRTVTSRVAKKLYRKQRKGPLHISRDQIMEIPAAGPPCGENDGGAREAVRQAIARLKEREQELVWLKVEQGLSNAKIAKILRIKESAVRGRWHRLRKKLGRSLRNPGTTVGR